MAVDASGGETARSGRMERMAIVVTGSDTGVGKTVVTAALVDALVRRGLPVLGLKPFASGERTDAEILYRVQQGRVSIDEINPWHFSKPLAPSIAGALEGRRVGAPEWRRWIRAAMMKIPSKPSSERAVSAKSTGYCVIEGAGGVLSPLGDGFDLVDVLRGFRRVWVVVVVPNRLGAINQSLLALNALPGHIGKRRTLVLMETAAADAAASGNVEFLSKRLGKKTVVEFPRLPGGVRLRLERGRGLAFPKAEKAVAAVWNAIRG